MSEIYQRIKELCSQKVISVSKMCSELNITRSCLSELSTGRTESLSASNTTKIAKYFGVSVSYIMNGDEKSSADDELKFALFNGTEGITDEMFEEVKQFAEMVKLREETKRKGGE